MATPPHPPPAGAPARPGTQAAPATPAPGTPAARRPWPDARVQGSWYERNRDHPVRLRLMDGSELTGVLVGADTYTLALRLPDRAESVLINKHAIAVLMRLEEGDSAHNSARATSGAPAPLSPPSGTRPGGA
jgi:sRNA-binding regulator protein Hfq